MINPHGDEVQGDISKCPYHQMMQKRKQQEEEEQQQPSSKEEQVQNHCPIDYKNLSKEQLEEVKNQMPSNHPTTQGKCPMGFDSTEYSEATAMNPSTDFMCPVCNTFAYQPIVFYNCQHCICKYCLEKQDSNMKTCLRCNEPINTKEQDSYRQFLISSYMETEWAHYFVNQVLHSSEVNPYSLIEEKEQDENNEDYIQQRVSKGTYYFQMGIEAQRGGNIESAMARCLMGLSLLNRFRKVEEAINKSKTIQQYYMEACNVMGVLYGYMSDLILQKQQESLVISYLQQSCDVLRNALQASFSVDEKYKSEIAMSFSTSLIKYINMVLLSEKCKELIQELLSVRRKYLLSNPAQEIAYAKLVFSYKEQIDSKELEFTKQMLEKRYSDTIFLQKAHPSMKQEFEQFISQL